MKMLINEDNQPVISFIVRASTRDILLLRLRKIMEITLFTNRGFDDFEYCEKSLYKVTMEGVGYEDLKTIKKHWNKLCKIGWFYNSDSCVILNGKVIFGQ
jgi:hypothetical protein